MNELNKSEILEWLRETDPARLQALYERADGVRKQNVGDAVHLRGLIEISSHCVRQCMYCGQPRGAGVGLGDVAGAGGKPAT